MELGGVGVVIKYISFFYYPPPRRRSAPLLRRRRTTHTPGGSAGPLSVERGKPIPWCRSAPPLSHGKGINHAAFRVMSSPPITAKFEKFCG